MRPCTIQTLRLQLHTLGLEHAPRLAQLGNDPFIAARTANMPSPYTLEAAQAYIRHATEVATSDLVFGIELHDGTLVGVINLKLSPHHRSGHLGYWMGAPYRGRGYMTEAARALVRHGFQTLGLHRIESACFAMNQASARVLEQIGLESEGCKRQAFFKDEVFHDLLLFGVTASAWEP